MTIRRYKIKQTKDAECSLSYSSNTFFHIRYRIHDHSMAMFLYLTSIKRSNSSNISTHAAASSSPRLTLLQQSVIDYRIEQLEDTSRILLDPYWSPLFKAYCEVYDLNLKLYYGERGIPF